VKMHSGVMPLSVPQRQPIAVHPTRHALNSLMCLFFILIWCTHVAAFFLALLGA
jgi:hypothetical protein